MKLMSFNCWGLAGPHKISTLKRVVGLEHLGILLLQETLGVGDVVKTKLENWFLGWDFTTLDVRGCSGVLEIGWNEKTVKALNLWGKESVLGINFQALALQTSFIVFNIYGLYLDMIPFWESRFNNPLLRGESVILGGDLNFSLGQAEVWGPHTRADLLIDYFTQKLVERNWLDIEPIKLKPTWRNNRCGEGRVANRLIGFW